MIRDVKDAPENAEGTCRALQGVLVVWGAIAFIVGSIGAAMTMRSYNRHVVSSFNSSTPLCLCLAVGAFYCCAEQPPVSLECVLMGWLATLLAGTRRRSAPRPRMKCTAEQYLVHIAIWHVHCFTRALRYCFCSRRYIELVKLDNRVSKLISVRLVHERDSGSSSTQPPRLICFPFLRLSLQLQSSIRV
jgi:hypothetical protein